MADLRSFLEELRGLSVQPPAPEPDVDLKDVGLEEGDAAKFRCRRRRQGARWWRVAGAVCRPAPACLPAGLMISAWQLHCAARCGCRAAAACSPTHALASKPAGLWLRPATLDLALLTLPALNPTPPRPTHPAGRRRTCGAAQCSKAWWRRARARSGRARATWCVPVRRNRALAAALPGLPFGRPTVHFAPPCRLPPEHPPQVFIHYSLSDASGDVLLSTRAEHGGAGRPQPFVLGRGRRMLRGMELGIMGAPPPACPPAGRMRAWAQQAQPMQQRGARDLAWGPRLQQRAYSPLSAAPPCHPHPAHLPARPPACPPACPPPTPPARPPAQRWRAASALCSTSSPPTPSCTPTAGCRGRAGCARRRASPPTSRWAGG